MTLTRTILLYSLPLLFAACSESTPADDPDTPDIKNTPIAFATNLEKETTTRAGITGAMSLATLQSSGFGVFAYNTGSDNYSTNTWNPDFMYNQDVVYSNGKWSYEPLKYWPTEGGKVSFFAYAPYVSEASATDEGISGLPSNTSSSQPIISYRLSTNGKNVDLLWGSGANSQPLTDLTVSEPTVNFYFRHALTRIGGAVESDDKATGLTIALDTTGMTDYNADSTKVTISKIRLEQIGLESVSSSSNSYSIYGSGDFNLYSAKWNVSDDKLVAIDTTQTSPYSQLCTISDSVKTLSAQASIKNDIAEPGKSKYTSDGTILTWDSVPKGVSTSATNIYGAESMPFLMIPVSGYRPLLRLTISYVTRVKDAGETKGYTEEKVTLKKTFALAQEPQPAYRYNISVKISPINTEVKVYTSIIYDKVTQTTYKGPDIREEDPKGDDKKWMSKKRHH